MCVAMCIDRHVYGDMCMDVCADMCVDMHRLACAHVHGHVYKHVHLCTCSYIGGWSQYGLFRHVAAGVCCSVPRHSGPVYRKQTHRAFVCSSV